MSVRLLLALPLLFLAQESFAQATDAPAPPPSGLLFSVSGDRGSTADIAHGATVPIFANGVKTVADGVKGRALAMDDDLTLAWSAPGNILAQRGTLSFFFRPRTPLGTAPFTIFRVGAADSTSWDFTFLRIDWNGHGFDAFTTDTSLARTRVSWRIDTIPAASDWIHIAFAWDERQGVTLWVNGRRVAEKRGQADYDMGLFGFGPFQRVVSPQKVESALNYMRSGDLDEIKVYDHALADPEVAALARGEAPEVTAAPARNMQDPAVRHEWTFRYGWNRISGPVGYADDKLIGIRKVEFADARDQKEKAFRGTDGIRETTWPGVYNRSRLPGRDDYFKLPDWNVYATAGKTYTLTLPEERWNHLEIIGAAHGKVDVRRSGRTDTVLRRAAGDVRTSAQLADDRQGGGTLTFTNDVQETPIQEIAAYEVKAIAAPPAGMVRLDYKVDPAASPTGYASLAPLTKRLLGRYPVDERATVVALPSGAPVIAATPSDRAQFPVDATNALPVVHILIPPTFRDQPPGGMPRRFSYGWENMDAGLDGVILALPALKLKPEADGLVPLNVRLHDPLWPDRDLIDVIVRVRPDRPQTLWLDSRDRILRPDDGISLTVAANDQAFDARSLAGATVSLVFKPAADARAEHVADRLEQARDELASLIEEQPSTRLFPVWDRFERDVSDVLRVDPTNAKARALWLEKNPEQAPAAEALSAPAPGVPLWAQRQTEDLALYRRFVDWWIDHRQIADGEFGGGLSDDTDLVNQWVGLALMGVEPDRLRRSQRAVLDATFANGMWDHGLSFIQADQLHSYEEGINTLGQAMLLSWGDPTELERAMAVARNYPRLVETNPAGHAHFVSAWFSGSRIDREGNLGWQYPYSFLITHPGMLLVDYNGAPAVRSIILGALDGWLAHGKQDSAGNWIYPREIEWATDKTRGTGVQSAVHDFWAAWKWTGDAKYLRPLEPKGLTGKSLPTLFTINADVLAQIPGGERLAGRIASGAEGTDSRAYDPNLGTVSPERAAEFVRWQETGDNNLLAGLYADEVQHTRQRFYLLTEAEFWSDRVAVPSELLQRARMGGVAHIRNYYYPGNLVSWTFDDPDVAEKVGILIPRGDPTHFKVVAFNMTDRLVVATMVGAMLTPGAWRETSGIDADGDNRADAPGAALVVTLERGLGTPLTLPPHQTIVFDFTLQARGDDPATRADVGISADDVAVHDRALTVTVHSLGAKPTAAGVASVFDDSGHLMARASFPALDAPIDLMPRTVKVSMKLPEKATSAPLRIALALQGDQPEVTMTNNQVRIDSVAGTRQ